MSEAAKTYHENPDARLFKILHERELLQAKAVISDDMPQSEFDAVCERIWALEEAAMHHPIRTPEGLAAYADLAREIMVTNLADEEPGHFDRVVLTLFSRVEDFAVQRAA